MKRSFGAEGKLVIARSGRPAALPADIAGDLQSDRVPLRLEAVKALAELRRGGAAGLRDAASAALIDLQDNDDGAGWLLGGAGFAASATIDLTGFPSVWFVLLWSGLAVTVATVYVIPLVRRKVELPAV